MKRMHRKQVSLAVLQALSAGVIVALTAPLAYAQTTPAPEKIEKLEVTGSRIPTPNATSTSPISSITATDIKFSAPLSIENLLNAMPQVVPDQGNMVSNGSTGTATVNLRGLGASRTLVLINGRPMPPGTPANGGYAADLNEIPTQLVQRIDIFTGGTSAVYGSDAIAGVVNFIMNDRFEGVQFDYGYSFYNHGQHSPIGAVVAKSAATNPSQFKVPGDVDSDGESSNYALTLGGNFADNKGNGTLFIGYQRTMPILQSQRDFSACSLASTGDNYVCAGSSNAATGRFTPSSGPQHGHRFTIANAAGDVRPFLSSDLFNFGPYNYFQGPDERWNVMALTHYDASPQARVYAEFGFSDDHSPRQIAPGADFGSINTLSFDNPLLSNQLKQTFGITPSTPVDVLIQRRNVEGGPRIFDYRTSSYRIVTGVKGEILGGWDYDVYYEDAKVIYSQQFKNDLSISRFTKALDVVTDPATGLPTCRSALPGGTDPSCVPWDIYHTGGVTPAQIAYIAVPAFQTGTTERRIYGGTLGADLGIYGLRSPWAKEAIAVSFGAENHVDKFALNTDEEFQTGDVEGLPIKSNQGDITSKEYFAEVRVPIIEDAPGAYYLAVNGSYRYSDISINQQTNTYGFGAEWNPIKQVKIRGSIQQAVRAPNIVELFLPQGLNLFNGQDPCGPTTNSATPSASLAQCLRTGLPASQYGASQLQSPAGQLNFLQGGNPNLTPETSHSQTFGVVFQPFRNLSASIDYYKITVDNVISTIPSALALSQCIAVGNFCNLIHRDAQGTLWLPGAGFVSGTNINVAKLQTSGVDFVANYRQPLPAGYGDIGFQFNGTYLNTFKYDTGVGLGPYDCAGYYGATCGGQAGIAINPLPRWKHVLRSTWFSPWNVDFAFTWRHINSVKLDLTSSDPQLAGGFNANEAQLGARDYLDLALSYAITKNFTLYAGVNNIFDRDPPLVPGSDGIGNTASNNGNTFPQTYDALGRRVFVTLTAKF